jgi:hypothetical protein
MVKFMLVEVKWYLVSCLYIQLEADVDITGGLGLELVYGCWLRIDHFSQID